MEQSLKKERTKKRSDFKHRIVKTCEKASTFSLEGEGKVGAWLGLAQQCIPSGQQQKRHTKTSF